jgi:hypothetical protein
MLAEVFRRLRPFQPIEDYTYIGFGGLWFVDFALFHRMLGINKMISIEDPKGSRDIQDRFTANRPFRSIDLDFRPSSEVLPELPYDHPYFFWLDYTDPMSVDILYDIRTVAGHAPSGTVLTVSLQCHQAQDVAEAAAEQGGLSAIERFRNRFGNGRVGQDVFDDDLQGWPFGRLSRRMIAGEIADALTARNGTNTGNPISFHSICEIEYRDGAPMTTIVGLFVSEQDRGKLTDCRFEQLDFLPRGDAKPIRIEVPHLTIREIRHLERQLPRSTEDEIEVGAIPRSDAENFAGLYRYFPNFAVIET